MDEIKLSWDAYKTLCKECSNLIQKLSSIFIEGQYSNSPHFGILNQASSIKKYRMNILESERKVWMGITSRLDRMKLLIMEIQDRWNRTRRLNVDRLLIQGQSFGKNKKKQVLVEKFKVIEEINGYFEEMISSLTSDYQLKVMICRHCNVDIEWDTRVELTPVIMEYYDATFRMSPLLNIQSIDQVCTKAVNMWKSSLD